MDFSLLRYEPLKETDRAAACGLLRSDPEGGEHLLHMLSEEPDTLMTAVWKERLVALACVGAQGPASFLMLFVAPELRGQGIGSAVAAYAEDVLRAGGTQKIWGAFRADNAAARAFSRHLGYENYFSTACMRRTGPPFPAEQVPVRPYADADYPVCQPMYARAFHEMRLHTGCFPDSVIAPPTEAGRRDWQTHEQDRFIYEDGGGIAAYSHICGDELSSVAVCVERQGHGIGGKFIAYLCNEIYRRGYAAVRLSCVVGNPARHLYDRLGFQETHVEDFPRKTLK
ncbi:MAG: GNAT family N-acetyltransferase [Clostridiaceae bacterium]|nr:GNAT family N-acetyltransferase [Clostridiaceae bacterium]